MSATVPQVPVDHDWFLAVVADHQRLIHKVCWAYAGSPQEREDLFQEIVVRLYVAARNYDPERKLSTWLYRVALNVAIDAHRRRAHRSREHLGLTDDLPCQAAEDPAVQEQLAELHRHLDTLPAADRALVLLHLDGNSHRDIGDVLGISESNVGTRLSRVKAALRRSLQPPT